MKLPVVWMVAAFAAGIGLAGEWHAPSHTQLVAWGVATGVAIAVGGVFAWRKRVVAGWALAIVAWLALGGLAASIEHAIVPANHVTRMIADGRLDTSEALRWRGGCARIPWRCRGANATKSIWRK
jgi:hypothetical protein